MPESVGPINNKYAEGAFRKMKCFMMLAMGERGEVPTVECLSWQIKDEVGAVVTPVCIPQITHCYQRKRASVTAF